MPFKNYYLILGVPREESQAGIRARYRDLVKQLHPDVAGEGSTAAFQEVSEAYDVLSDPEHRRRFNRDLRIREGYATYRPAPLGSEVPGRTRGPMSLRDFQSVRPSMEALFERILRNFTGADVPKSEHLEPLNFEVILTPEEAARGGRVPLRIPVFRTCMHCRGRGRDWMFTCSRCAGQGLVPEDHAVEVPIPPIHRSPAVFEAPLHGLGITNLVVRLHIRVARRESAV